MRNSTTQVDERLLAEFETGVSTSLLGWADRLAELPADILVFMARKSFCVYDVLQRHLGIRPVDAVVVSDRVLDLSLDPLMGKRVALIDDALIVGTTLARTVRLLQDNGVENVSVHAFCRDRDNAVRDLVELESLALDLSEDDVRRFCSAEIRMLALAPRPYAVDFPVLEPVRLTRDAFERVVSGIGWDAYNLTTDLQENAGVFVYTFMPSPEILDGLTSSLKSDVRDLAALTKIRAFGANVHDHVEVQFVPLVTLRPTSESAIDALTSQMAAEVEVATGESIEGLVQSLRDKRAGQRLIQYSISSALGSSFADWASSTAGMPISWLDSEAGSHWGPWHGVEMQRVQFAAAQSAPVPESARALVADVPSEALKLANEVFERAAATAPLGLGSSEARTEPDATNEYWDPLVEFAQIFLALYEHLEPQARERAAAESAAVVVSDERDRLARGIPWEAILGFFAEHRQTGPQGNASEALSLLLDICHDLGVVVPITCRSGDVLYRAYRYGEDVHITDGELDLAFAAADGFLTESQRETIPRLVLEKLLVLLVKVGTARGFLRQSLHSRRKARVGFHLKGAITIVSGSYPTEGEQDSWLSSYLVRRGVLLEGDQDQYRLGGRIGGTTQTKSAEDDAREVGMVLADLYGQEAPLGARELILLTSVGTPRDTLAAVRAELCIVADWWASEGRHLSCFEALPDKEQARDVQRRLVRSTGHEAVHSAAMKFEAYGSSEHQELVKQTTQWLERDDTLASRTLATRWRGHWELLQPSEPTADVAESDPLLQRAAVLLHAFGAMLSLAEISLEILGERNSQRAYDKLRRLDQSFTFEGRTLHPVTQQIHRRLLDDADHRPPDPERAFEYIAHSMTELIPHCTRVAEAMDPVIRRLAGRSQEQSYDYLVWYDVIDSTGAQAAARGENVEVRRESVAGFKSFVNGELADLQDRAASEGLALTAWNGTIPSSNDEKHIFVGGTGSAKLASEVLDILTTAAQSHQVTFRAAVVSTGFAGTGAYRSLDEGEVRGARFWEHLSRIMQEVKAREQNYDSSRCGILTFVGVERSEIQIPSAVTWEPDDPEMLRSDIEGLSRETAVCMGSLAFV